MTGDLAVMLAFAEARLAEEEAAAKSAFRSVLEADSFHVYAPARPGVPRLPVADAIDAETAAHIARYAPARVLREVAAKRARIERYKRAVAATSSVSSFMRGQDDGYAEACLDSIRDDTATWSDHPEYQEGWKP